MKSRYEQYTSGEITHREFYKPFVKESLKTAVRSKILLERLLASNDPHLNDIPLKEWDDLVFLLPIRDMLDAGMNTVNARSIRVCIAKEAACQLIDEHKDTSTMVVEG